MRAWLGWLAVAALLSFVVGLGIRAMYDAGLRQGMKDYHGICYYIGGTLVDKEDGTVVQCMALDKIPKDELKNF